MQLKRKVLKQIILIKHNRVKNPNWPEANPIYKRSRGFELRTTENKTSQRSERDWNSGPPNFKSSALTTRLRCLLTCLATFLQNELNSDVARYTTHIKPVLQQIRLLTGLNVAGKTRTIAFELVLQQKLQNKLHLFVARFTEALAVRAKMVLQLLFFSGFKTAY